MDNETIESQRNILMAGTFVLAVVLALVVFFVFKKSAKRKGNNKPS
jgi:cbb3-type cytochrome oxidase subunit 3